MLVDRNGFTYTWKPGKAPVLRKGKFSIVCNPHFNVPFIFASKARGNLSSRTPNFEEIVSDEMKGLEDLIPTTGSGAIPAQNAIEEIPEVPKLDPPQARGRPRVRKQRG